MSDQPTNGHNKVCEPLFAPPPLTKPTPLLRWPHARHVFAGEKIPQRVDGGYARKSAPTSGVLVEFRDEVWFVPAALLESAGWFRRGGGRK